MGSKTPEYEDNGGFGGSSNSDKPSSVGGEPRGAHTTRDGDGSIGDGGDDDDDGDGDNNGEVVSVSLNGAASVDATKKKKRKRPKKKKTAQKKQSSPPRIPLDELFPSGEYPVGELQSYNAAPGNTARTTAEELRYQSRRHLEDDTVLNDYRKAAEVHRQVRHWVQDTVKPGQTLRDIAVGIDDGVRALLGNDGLKPGDGMRSGLGFPTGLSVNNCVAHYTPNPGQKDIVLQHGDVMKVDFGVHVSGWIVDSAFTMSFDPVYDNLLAASRDATNTGLRTAGIDVRICDISAVIQETLESYEVELNGKTYPVKPVRNLCAHDIKRYRIHGEKQIPMMRNNDQTKMEDGEVFAIETFGTTGRGYTFDDAGVYGYGVAQGAPAKVSLPLASANRLHKTIRDHFGTIVFCRRYLERLGVNRYLAGLNCLVSNGILESYPPLMDVKGSYSAQFEHTVLMRDKGKEVISRGFDW